MTIHAAIRTLKADFEGGLNSRNRTTAEQTRYNRALIEVNAAEIAGTYAEARAQVAHEDDWEHAFPGVLNG